MRTIFILWLLFIYQNVLGQNVYFSGIKDLPDPYLGVVIGHFNPLTCNLEEMHNDTTMDINPPVDYRELNSIALVTDTTIACMGFDGLYMFHIPTNTFSKFTDRPQPMSLQWRGGMLALNDSLLFFGSRDFFTCNLNTNQIEYLGRIPNGMQISNCIFNYNGLIMGSGYSKIITLDPNDIMNSNIYCELSEPFDQGGFVTLIDIAIDCDSTATFALHNYGDIYLFNPNTCESTFYCSLEIDNLSIFFEGSSPAFDFIPPPPCEISIDLDPGDQTSSGHDVIDTLMCTVSEPILTIPVEMFSDKSWDSVSIALIGAPTGIGLQCLPEPLFATVTGQMTSELHFYSSGLSDLDALNPFINQITFTGTWPPGISSCQIACLAWADGLVSDTAMARLTIIVPTMMAGQDSSMVLCHDQVSLNLNTLLSPDASLDGQWIPSLSHPPIFNPASDPESSFVYVVVDPYCGADTALITIEMPDETHIELKRSGTFCPGQSIDLTLPDQPDGVYWVSPAEPGPTITLSQPQLLITGWTDSYGCLQLDTLILTFDNGCPDAPLYIPNVFSPNGDGINDSWDISPVSGITHLDLHIYDRWGNLLYHENGTNLSWDGRDKHNRIVSTGVFTYRIIYESLHRQNGLLTGDVTIIN